MHGNSPRDEKLIGGLLSGENGGFGLKPGNKVLRFAPGINGLTEKVNDTQSTQKKKLMMSNLRPLRFFCVFARTCFCQLFGQPPKGL
ncbi:hypothetical protein [Maribellus sp. YY47]|uniref:hypothetical protein n=1 Tax=Maribellus sp. YY47 TaxID=2929486 RepID=UPI002000B109|nr:hypothetical protein [Maribellus sp. YY47]MCK3684976.1 hypothetical protein [Maribellus sp. YY47]